MAKEEKMYQNILGQIVLLHLDIHVWSGRRKLAPEDLKLADGSELPPESLARLGSKKVIDPEKLNDLMAVRSEAHRLALTTGTRLMGGYAIPVGRMAELKEKLDALMSKGRELKNELLDGLTQAVEEWKEKNPGWEALIDRADINPETVGRAISFSWQVYNIAPVEGQEEGLEAEVSGMAGQLRHEIEVEARVLWKKSFQGKPEVTQRALRPIRAMAKKIQGLVFLEPELEELVNGICDALSGLPKKGPVKGKDFTSVCGIVGLLGNIPTAVAEAEAVIAAAEAEAEAEDTEGQEGNLLEEETADTQAVRTPPFMAASAQAPPPAPPAEWF
jgi:hypothetical protein